MDHLNCPRPVCRYCDYCASPGLFFREKWKERERGNERNKRYAHIYDMAWGEWVFAGRILAARVRAYHAFDVGVGIDGGGRRGQERPRGRNTKAELHICVWGVGYQPKQKGLWCEF